MDGLALTSDILYGVGGALAATGLILLVWPSKDDTTDTGESSAPVVSFAPTPGGVIAEVSF